MRFINDLLIEKINSVNELSDEQRTALINFKTILEKPTGEALNAVEEDPKEIRMKWLKGNASLFGVKIDDGNGVEIDDGKEKITIKADVDVDVDVESIDALKEAVNTKLTVKNDHIAPEDGHLIVKPADMPSFLDSAVPLNSVSSGPADPVLPPVSASPTGGTPDPLMSSSSMSSPPPFAGAPQALPFGGVAPYTQFTPVQKEEDALLCNKIIQNISLFPTSNSSLDQIAAVAAVRAASNDISKMTAALKNNWSTLIGQANSVCPQEFSLSQESCNELQQTAQDKLKNLNKESIQTQILRVEGCTDADKRMPAPQFEVMKGLGLFNPDHEEISKAEFQQLKHEVGELLLKGANPADLVTIVNKMMENDIRRTRHFTFCKDEGGRLAELGKLEPDQLKTMAKVVENMPKGSLNTKLFDNTFNIILNAVKDAHHPLDLEKAEALNQVIVTMAEKSVPFDRVQHPRLATAASSVLGGIGLVGGGLVGAAGGLAVGGLGGGVAGGLAGGGVGGDLLLGASGLMRRHVSQIPHLMKMEVDQLKVLATALHQTNPNQLNCFDFDSLRRGIVENSIDNLKQGQALGTIISLMKQHNIRTQLPGCFHWFNNINALCKDKDNLESKATLITMLHNKNMLNETTFRNSTFDEVLNMTNNNHITFLNTVLQKLPLAINPITIAEFKFIKHLVEKEGPGRVDTEAKASAIGNVMAQMRASNIPLMNTLLPGDRLGKLAELGVEQLQVLHKILDSLTLRVGKDMLDHLLKNPADLTCQQGENECKPTKKAAAICDVFDAIKDARIDPTGHRQPLVKMDEDNLKHLATIIKQLHRDAIMDKQVTKSEFKELREHLAKKPCPIQNDSHAKSVGSVIQWMKDRGIDLTHTASSRLAFRGDKLDNLIHTKPEEAEAINHIATALKASLDAKIMSYLLKHKVDIPEKADSIVAIFNLIPPADQKGLREPIMDLKPEQLRFLNKQLKTHEDLGVTIDQTYIRNYISQAKLVHPSVANENQPEDPSMSNNNVHKMRR